MKRYFQPNRDADFAKWLENLATKLPGYREPLSISAEDIARVVKSSAFFKFMLDRIDIEKSYAQAMVGFKEILRNGGKNENSNGYPPPPPAARPPEAVEPNVAEFMGRLVKTIKGNVNYTEAIGRDLGIIGSEKSGLSPDMKPVLKISLNAGKPVISYKKLAAAGIDLYVSRDNETVFSFLATAMKPKFEDASVIHGSSEKWGYKAIYRDKDRQIGQFSDVASVVVGRS